MRREGGAVTSRAPAPAAHREELVDKSRVSSMLGLFVDLNLILILGILFA